MARKQQNATKKKREGRDARGLFTKGNKLSPGNPRLRAVYQWRRALEEATTFEEVTKVIRALMDKALTGDVDAIRELLDRALGRPNREPRAVVLDLGTPKTTAELVAAYGKLIGATTRGEISTDDAKALNEMLSGALRVSEIAELEQRIKALEAQRAGELGGESRG